MRGAVPASAPLSAVARSSGARGTECSRARAICVRRSHRPSDAMTPSPLGFWLRSGSSRLSRARIGLLATHQRLNLTVKRNGLPDFLVRSIK